MAKGILEIKMDEECIDCPLIDLQTKTISGYNDMTGKYKTVVTHSCTRAVACEELRNHLKEVYHIKEEEKDGQE